MGNEIAKRIELEKREKMLHERLASDTQRLQAASTFEAVKKRLNTP
ncbi:MAG: hypothetical protein R3D55_13780 [Chloroflexota bacterium]